MVGENTHLLSEVLSFPRFQRSYFVTILTPLKHACKQDSKSQTIYRRAYSYLDTLEISAIDLRSYISNCILWYRRIEGFVYSMWTYD